MKKDKAAEGVKASHREMSMSSLDMIVGFHMRKGILRAQSAFAKAAGRKLLTGQYSVMAIIDENPGRTQTAIAEAAGLDRSSLVPILTRLEKNGFITRRQVEGDKRAYAVSLTNKGRQELAELDKEVQVLEAKFIRGLGEKNHARLIELLKEFNKIL